MDQELAIHFAEARRRLPELTQGSSPLGFGSFGLVIDHHDGSVSKLYFRNDDIDLPIDPKGGMATEVRCLSRLARQPFTGLQVPSLIEQPDILSDEKFQAVLRMSKLPGRQIDWPNLDDASISLNTFEAYYRSAGRLLARFHAVALQAELASPQPVRAGREVAHIHGTDDATNRALERAANYYRGNRRAGIVYGNLSADTVFVDEALLATGIADFNSVRHSENVYSDFTDVPELGREDFFEGYSEESGARVGSIDVAVGEAMHWARNANRQPAGSEQWNGTILRLRQHLDEARSVTGYRLRL